MTTTELYNELSTLDRRIEVLELLINNECACFTSCDEKFNEANLKDLCIYKERKQYLLRLQDKSEAILSALPSHPIVKVCMV